VKNSDGTDSMLTFKIVTDHKECLLIVRALLFEPTHAFHCFRSTALLIDD
tara:strand:- start:3286 stop:3435 length:150 start_codon:yes stop_codon:yes gene_type:complete